MQVPTGVLKKHKNTDDFDSGMKLRVRFERVATMASRSSAETLQG